MKKFKISPKSKIIASKSGYDSYGGKIAEQLELDIVSDYDDDGEYVGAHLFLSHDNGRDRKEIAAFNQFQELKMSVGEMLADYFDEMGL